MKSERLDLQEVQRRKRCIFYELFEFIHPQRGQLQDEESRQAALATFIASHDTPRTIKDEGINRDGGQHDVNSLMEMIRSTVQKKSPSPGPPLDSFFNVGFKSVKRTYYEDILKTYRKHRPNAAVRDRWLSSKDGENEIDVPGDEAEVSGNSSNKGAVERPQASKSAGEKFKRRAAISDDLCDEKLNQDMKPARTGMQKELLGLHR
jgi:hypothetical protein